MDSQGGDVPGGIQRLRSLHAAGQRELPVPGADGPVGVVQANGASDLGGDARAQHADQQQVQGIVGPCVRLIVRDGGGERGGERVGQRGGEELGGEWGGEWEGERGEERGGCLGRAVVTKLGGVKHNLTLTSVWRQLEEEVAHSRELSKVLNRRQKKLISASAGGSVGVSERPPPPSDMELQRRKEIKQLESEVELLRERLLAAEREKARALQRRNNQRGSTEERGAARVLCQKYDKAAAALKAERDNMTALRARLCSVQDELAEQVGLVASLNAKWSELSEEVEQVSAELEATKSDATIKAAALASETLSAQKRVAAEQRKTDRKRMRGTKQLLTRLAVCEARCAELTSIRRAEAASQIRRLPPEPDAIIDAPKGPCPLSPTSKKVRAVKVRRELDRKNRRCRQLDVSLVDVSALAAAVSKANLTAELFDTPEFWPLRIKDAQAHVDRMNAAWGSVETLRKKQDYLWSNRDADAMRVDWSMELVGGKPRPRVLVCNPHRAWDQQQRVHFAEPIAPRCGKRGWEAPLKAQDALFGLEYNPLHRDCTERGFVVQLQEHSKGCPCPTLALPRLRMTAVRTQALVDRDADILLPPETFSEAFPLEVVLGFDGADDFTHLLMRIINYKDGVCKESEMKGVALAVGMGDDHNPNLTRMFGHRLGQEISAHLPYSPSTGRCGFVTLKGQRLPVRVSTCLDHSASRSMNGLRSNASPHSRQLHPHLEIPTPTDATWPDIKAAIQRKMPWRDDSDAQHCCLAHFAPVFPWKCPAQGCGYCVQDEAEQHSNIEAMMAMRDDKTDKGVKAWAKRVAAHCERHDLVMEFQVQSSQLPVTRAFSKPRVPACLRCASSV